MEYLKKFYDLLGSEHGKIRPLINEGPLPVEDKKSLPNEVTPSLGVLTTSAGVITIDKDKSMNINGKPLHTTLMTRYENPGFGQNPEYRTEMTLEKVKKEGDKIILKLSNNTTLNVPINDLSAQINSKNSASSKIFSTVGSDKKSYQIFWKS